MKLIATVNGKTVHSDKPVRSISNTRITFADGSWCDVESGQIHSVGSGSISIGGSASATEKITRGPTKVTAKKLNVHDIHADIRVEVHNEDNIEYSIVGPADVAEAIRASVLDAGSELEITGSLASKRSNNVFSVGGNFNVGGISISSHGSSIVIGGSSKAASDTLVTVKVPKGTSINIIDVQGDTKIGDTDGYLRAEVHSSHDIKAGRLSGANLRIQGSGDIEIAEVNGDVTASIIGSGDVEIAAGTIGALSAKIQGSGDITIDAVVSSADLKIQGSGDIRIERVRTEPRKLVQGSGKVKIRHLG